MNHSSKATFQFPLTDLLVLPAVIGLILSKNGLEALRDGLPLVFSIWIAIRQRKMLGIKIVNPFTAGMMAGTISYPLHSFAVSKQTMAITDKVLYDTIVGGLTGLFIGFIATMYVAIAMALWESFSKRG